MAEVLCHDLKKGPGIDRLLTRFPDGHRETGSRHGSHKHGGCPCMEADLCGDDGFVLGQTGSF